MNHMAGDALGTSAGSAVISGQETASTQDQAASVEMLGYPSVIEIDQAIETLHKARAVLVRTQSKPDAWLEDFRAKSTDVREVSIVAQRCRVSVDTIKNWCEKDPSIGGRIGKRWYASISRAENFQILRRSSS